jgi:apolipoprotein N-acyltransferase
VSLPVATPRATLARNVTVCIGGGALLTLAFPEPDLAPLAWICVAPLLVALRAAGPARGVALGFLFGVAFFGTLLAWITIVGYVAWVVLVIVQAAYLGLFGLLVALAGKRLSSLALVAACPVLWVAVDYVRGNFPVGGFTWGQLAQSQHDLGWMLRPAGVGGAWAVTFLLVLVNSILAWGWVRLRDGDRRGPVGASAAAALVLIAPAALPRADATGAPVEVGIVQGNVPRDFEGSFFDKNLVILENHIRLTENLGTDPPDIVVWPESSVGEDLNEVPEVRAGIERAERAVGVPLIVGANIDAGPEHYKVMALEIGEDGSVTDRYQKTHLVPFGEYVPARGLFQWIPMLDQIPRDAIAADESVVFDVAGGAVAPVISFEGDFGSLVRRRIDAGGRLLVVATNTSTWGESWASAQHVAFGQLRAAENGVWVVHAAISGISAFIDPEGRVVAETPLWRAATLRHTVRFATDVTFYARVGDWLPVACLAVMALGAAVLLATRARRPAGGREGRRA